MSDEYIPKLKWTEYFGITKYAGNWKNHFELLGIGPEKYHLWAYTYSQFDDQPHSYYDKNFDSELEAMKKADELAVAIEMKEVMG